jgi:predicted RNA methylase
MPGGPVFLGQRSTFIDVMTVVDVWSGPMFPADCRDRVVLDIGAHKGYFGAWALAQGATAVVSCEPESENFRLLSRAVAANDRRAAWEVDRVALDGVERVGGALAPLRTRIAVETSQPTTRPLPSQ